MASEKQFQKEIISLNKYQLIYKNYQQNEYKIWLMNFNLFHNLLKLKKYGKIWYFGFNNKALL